MYGYIYAVRAKDTRRWSKMTNVNYNLRYVAFLDLLGFKNMVNQSVENQTILNNINRALNYIE